MLERRGMYAPTLLYGRALWVDDLQNPEIFLRKRHYHIVYIERGSHRITMPDGVAHSCSEHGSYLIPPGGAKVVVSRGSWAISIACIVSAEALEPVPHCLALRQLESKCQPAPHAVWGCELPVVMDQRLTDRIRRDLRVIVEEWWVDEAANLKAQHVLSRILHAVVSRYRQIKPAVIDAEQTLLAQAQALLKQQAITLRGVGDLADRLGMSRRHLTRLFAPTPEGSPGRALRHHRLAAVERMLREETASIAEIAARMRFTSVAAMSRSFQARYGVSPQRFRKA